jgi:hypothetical protein
VGAVEVHEQVAGLLGQPGSISRGDNKRCPGSGPGLHLHRRKHGDNVLEITPGLLT